MHRRLNIFIPALLATGAVGFSAAFFIFAGHAQDSRDQIVRNTKAEDQRICEIFNNKLETIVLNAQNRTEMNAKEFPPKVATALLRTSRENTAQTLQEIDEGKCP